MKTSSILFCIFFLLPIGVYAQSNDVKSKPATESSCTDRADNDKDSMVDCADADCFKDAACQPDGGPENTNARCSDWVDNDKDGSLDCDDMECQATSITICQGSWRSPIKSSTNTSAPKTDLKKGLSYVDLIGTGTDKDGERNDMLCTDGIDNDGDGATDCADYGCRFDPSVTVCHGNPGMRFSIVASIAQSYDFQAENTQEALDTRFSKLQLRSFGPIYPIQNSFYLVSMRAEKTPRFTFAMFQIPIGGGHYMNINSGGGGLSNALVISSSKQLLLDPAYYLYSAFEQGNGAALEVGGPVTANNKIRYRTFAAGGSGRWAGNLGGRYFTYDNANYTWSVGGQLHFNIIGMYSRWDTPFLYTPVPLTFAIAAGAKYDQRAQERYPAANISVALRWNRLVLLAENYTKRELEFRSWQTAYNLQIGYLLWSKKLLLAADYGRYYAGEREIEPVQEQTDLRKERNETQWRVAMHYYFWQNIGVASILYTDRTADPIKVDDPQVREQELRITAQYRF